MKQVMRYRGMAIKQVTERDVKTGNRPHYQQLGEMEVYNEDGDIEYDCIGTIQEAKEKIDGLLSDRRRSR